MSPFKILFVCSKNQWRSPTAAAIYRNDPRLAVKSAGLSNKSPTVVSAKLLEWAELVIVMENKHVTRIRDHFRNQMQLPDIVSLEIPDDYEFMHPELIKLLKISVTGLLDEFLI